MFEPLSLETDSSKSVTQLSQVSDIHIYSWRSMQGAWRRHRWPRNFPLLLMQFLHSFLELDEVDREREAMVEITRG